MNRSSHSIIKRVAFIGNYLPRQCGIATFTTDLSEAVAAEYKGTSCIAVPVNDTEAGYAYPSPVRFELAEKDIQSYRRAADFLNINNVHIVSLQHEYGIFGGRAGSHILTLLRELRMPIVTTLHTILREPDPDQRRILEEIARLSGRLVVMSERAREFLQEIYRVPPEKIDLIPHGIPDLPFIDPSFHKDLFGVEGKTVLLSFGLLSPNKGIENVIRALPAILQQHPNVVYFVLGATHPHVLRDQGESYRLSLHWLAQEMGVDGNVIFYNRFVELEELIQFISAADVYITPYLDEAQIVSGTLAYTLGAGKAVVSTPYWYAQEMLADGRGVLVPFADAQALADRIIDLLDNEAARHAMRKRAYLFGRDMIWPQVARRYMMSFERARFERHHFAVPEFTVKPLDRRPQELPPLKLDHLHHLTDATGILQHATFTIPDYGQGYATDDNARALLLSALLEELGYKEAPNLATRYMAFLWYAFDPETRRFRNFMNYERHWLEQQGSEDCHGRALWALGTILGRSANASLHQMASRIFQQSLLSILDTTSPRAWSFTMLGVNEYLRRFSGDRRAAQVQSELGERLMTLYRACRTDDWRWFENILSYCNAALPHALLIWGSSSSHDAALQAGLETLRWLAKVHRPDGAAGHFVPIGSNGFYTKSGARARFDQQPVEAQAMVGACLAAWRVTSDESWRKEGRRAFEWFLGRNDLNAPLYDPTTGGCRDGLHPDRPNENQGAESTLAFLHSLLELRLIDNEIRTEEKAAHESAHPGALQALEGQSHPAGDRLAVPGK